MPITLSAPLVSWLQSEVASGRYASVDAAVEAIVASYVADRNAQRSASGRLNEDPAWASGLIDQVRAQIAQGESETVHAFASFVQKSRGKPSGGA